MKPAWELAQVIERFGRDYQQRYAPNAYRSSVLRAIEQCRTSTMGGHIDRCTSCGHLRISYNSCRNRHCPKCQNTQREAWIAQRKQHLLPVPYFHIVFTVPNKLNRLFLWDPPQMYNLLFRAKFLAGLEKFGVFDARLRRELLHHLWVVYAKDPFAGPGSVVEYLGRYSHKVAISNHRIVKIDEQGVSFRWRDYRDNKEKLMQLDGVEFLRRFSQHILPRGFVRIRHYGLLSATHRPRLHQLQICLGVMPEKKEEKPDWKHICRKHLNYDPDRCPHCHKPTMVMVERFLPGRGPPDHLWVNKLKTLK